MFEHEKNRKILHILKIWHLSENFLTHPRTVKIINTVYVQYNSVGQI